MRVCYNKQTFFPSCLDDVKNKQTNKRWTLSWSPFQGQLLRELSLTLPRIWITVMYIKATSDTIHHPGTVNKHTHTHACTNQSLCDTVMLHFICCHRYLCSVEVWKRRSNPVTRILTRILCIAHHIMYEMFTTRQKILVRRPRIGLKVDHKHVNVSRRHSSGCYRDCPSPTVVSRHRMLCWINTNSLNCFKKSNTLLEVLKYRQKKQQHINKIQLMTKQPYN